MTPSRARRIFVRKFFASAGTPVPGMTRDLPQTHEAPDHVRGGIAAKVNATLTRPANSLKSLTPKPRHAWRPA